MTGALVGGKTPTIVVIDDSPTSISLYQRSTDSLNVALATFESAEESLGFLEENEADLVFLDILMRTRDGLGLLSDLRNDPRHQDTPVVIVTTKDYFQDRARAKELGALDYLVKPLRSQEIREIIYKYTEAAPKDDAPGT